MVLWMPLYGRGGQLDELQAWHCREQLRKEPASEAYGCNSAHCLRKCSQVLSVKEILLVAESTRCANDLF